MSGEATALLQQALNLSPDERFQVAQQLLDSLGGDSQLPDDAEFRAELDHRLETVANGTAELIPWTEARESLRAELDRRREARRGTAP